MAGVKKEKEVTRRILMDLDSARAVDQYIGKLKDNGCKKIDASKVVSSILGIFFEKYAESSFKRIRGELFDKKSYLLKIINDSSDEDFDDNMASYFQEMKKQKRRGRKPKIKKPNNNDEAQSTG